MTAQLQGKSCEFRAAPGGSCQARYGLGGMFERLFIQEAECVYAAARCLAEMGPAAAPALPALIDAAQHGPNNYDTGDGIVPARDAILDALGATGDRRAVAVLIEALENPKPVDAGPGAVGFASKKPAGEAAALRALGRLDPLASEAVPRIVPHLARPGSAPEDQHVVEAAASALGDIGNPEAIPALTEALKREAVAARAADALGRFGPAARAALPALIRLIEEAPERYGETLIRRAIASIGGRGAVEGLPKSYSMMMNDIWRFARDTAKQRSIRLGRVHLDAPGESITAAFADGATLIITFGRESWASRRTAEGTITIGQSGRKAAVQAYHGRRQLDSLLAEVLKPER